MDQGKTAWFTSRCFFDSPALLKPCRIIKIEEVNSNTGGFHPALPRPHKDIFQATVSAKAH